MSIITFYSYKGGVGRSMALANVAVALAARRLRVLVVDWDLEAPGIEHFFTDLRVESGGPGLLAMLREVSDGRRPDYRAFTWRISDVDNKFGFSLLHAGRETDPEYFAHLEQFNWASFFRAGGGNFLEQLRESWLSDFDFVLIDSRTGLSDAGGVCTIQLPDIIVAVFTASEQSLFGVRDVMRLAQAARQRLAYDRSTLSIVALPSRMDRQEPSYAGWIERCANELDELFADWLPRHAKRADVLDKLAIGHSSAMVHGERLAIHSSKDQDLSREYLRLANLLASNLADVSGLVDDHHGTGRVRPTVTTTPEYEFDVYISYPRSALATRWVHETLLPELNNYLSFELGRSPRIYLDMAEVAIGDDWAESQRVALSRSHVMLAVWTASYFRSKWCMAELETFRRRSDLVGQSWVPILLAGRSALPKSATLYELISFESDFIISPAFRRTPSYVEFIIRVQDLALKLSFLLTATPTRPADLTVVEPTMVSVDAPSEDSVERTDAIMSTSLTRRG